MSETPEKPYRSISEVSELIGVKPHVLRYWETQFSMLRPRKHRGGVRMYRPQDIELLQEIKHLLHQRGFTIAGARRKLLAERHGAVADAGQQEMPLNDVSQPLLRRLRRELAELRALLEEPPRRSGA